VVHVKLSMVPIFTPAKDLPRGKNLPMSPTVNKFIRIDP
jgi:hypothetical protein